MNFDILRGEHVPKLPITDTNLSSGGLPSLVLTFFADSSVLNTPTTLISAALCVIEAINHATT